MLDNHTPAIRIGRIDRDVIGFEDRQSPRMSLADGDIHTALNTDSHFVEGRGFEHHHAKVGESWGIFNPTYPFLTPRTPSASVRI